MTNTQANSAKYLRATDGVVIAYCAPPPRADLPAVALVHSLAMDHHFWDPVAERLMDHATVVAIDARGHGRSGRGETPYTVQRMARDLLEVLDELKIPQAVVAGASMGGCVALQFAGDHPRRVKSLALIDTTAWYGPTAAQDWEGRAMKAVTHGLRSLVEFQKTRWFSDAFRSREPQVVQACIDTFLANHIDAYVATCRMLGSFDGRPFLRAVGVPTLVLVGEEDYAAPIEMAKALNEGIAGSLLEILPGARHLTPLEVPDLIAARLRELSDGSSR